MAARRRLLLAPFLLLAASCHHAAAAHPAAFPCRNDTATRLQLPVRPGTQIMHTTPVAGNATADGVAVALNPAKTQVTVTIPQGMFFAARVNHGGTLKPAADVAPPSPVKSTAGCGNQVFLPTTPGPAAGTYRLDVRVPADAPGGFGRVTVGYANAVGRVRVLESPKIPASSSPSPPAACSCGARPGSSKYQPLCAAQASWAACQDVTQTCEWTCPCSCATLPGVSPKYQPLCAAQMNQTACGGYTQTCAWACNATGSQKWAFLTGGDVSSPTVSPTVSPDGAVVYVGSNDHLYAVNTADGSKKWAFLTGGDVSSPTVSPDGAVVYVGSDDKSLYAVNTADGSKKWAFKTGDEVSSPTLSPDGAVVYVGSNDKSLYAVNA